MRREFSRGTGEKIVSLYEVDTCRLEVVGVGRNAGEDCY